MTMKGVEYAKSKQTIMLDFTGWEGVNCRKMEEQVYLIRSQKNVS